ncbi:ferredoxin protochlorophyllide reductase subunit B [Roseibium hamelinense]|uniref:Light-independent protochlorophyllide reductase subunit B n=1 Tax=Roseibium hamelinense TaxID=150831 RepID=A0A562SXH1_9HYPH|nr:ferredoxin:protochlorophyllide reductase (ATP-dependent) subunit B [Roseibium hamelinense]MTI44864.1 ferredoxin:protochlorophyllide reductase (ATP-dependent) subunit B [Roseibium hamelinense]TWI85942.1 ferredoxin protochlorophyllide reductase subunit B [Roseibium hamelinense]
MELATWTYEGPPHIGAIRVAASMEGVHLVLHAPQGDTYADLLFTMIERRKTRPPVTYTTFQARDLSGDTAEIFKDACRDVAERFDPQLMLVGASCTAELLQDDPGGLAKTLDLSVPVVPLELPSYQKKENWGASETFYRLVRACSSGWQGDSGPDAERQKTCNILGPTSLGFRNRDDVEEVKRLLADLGVRVNVIAPLGATPADLARLPGAGFNVVLYPEIAAPAARWLKKTFGQESVTVQPIGVGACRDFIAAVCACAGLPDRAKCMQERLSWYSRSIDSNYLTGKRVFVYGDATHAIAAARICEEELGFKLCGLGTYSREFARDIRAVAEHYDVAPLITDNHLDVEDAIIAAQPELVLGTQMERHVAKRLRLPCAVISSPVHVQDFPARYSPQMGAEGANVIFDTWVHPLMMGLEEHLLQMFRGDFEFHDDVSASHLAAVAPQDHSASRPVELASVEPEADEPDVLTWTDSAERELKKIPFFVRGKARRNTENFAAERGLNPITIETLYDAKAHFGR